MTFTDRLNELLTDAGAPLRAPHSHAQYAQALIDTARDLLLHLPLGSGSDPLAVDEAGLLLLAAGTDLASLEPIAPSTAPWFPLDPTDASPAMVLGACLRLIDSAAARLGLLDPDELGAAQTVARAEARLKTAWETLAATGVPTAVDSDDQPR